MHTNQKLFDLATKNSQRIAADEFINELPSDLREHFKKDEAIFHPEITSQLGSAIHRSIQLQKAAEPGTRVILTSSREKAIGVFKEWVSLLPDGKYLLVVAGGDSIKFDGQNYWVPHLPGFTIVLPLERNLIDRLFSQGIDEILLAAVNGNSAVVLGSSSGFLPDEPSPEEVVFELSSW